MEIIQVPLTDRQKPSENIRTRTFFILNDRLDEDVLRSGLDRLIRDHWRKLGARLITRPRDGLPEYHLPRIFDEKYLLFNWSSQKYGHSIDKIEFFPKPSPPENGVALLPPLQFIENWLRPSDWPLDRKGEPAGAPMLYVHMSLFADTTVIGINCPHILVDQFGKANIMKAWLGLIKGEVPPPMIGVSNDILANGKSYAEYPVDEIVRKGRTRVRRWGEYPIVIMALIAEMIGDWKEDEYTMFLPLPLVDSLRERHSRALTAKYGADPGISNGDIISGILLKLVRFNCKSTNTLSLSQSVNLRGRLPQLTEDRDAFIHNCLQFATARFKFNRFTPLSEVAYQNRMAIKQAVDLKDIEISLTATREMVRRGQPTVICEPFEKSYFVTNWSAAWKGLDFSPALKGQREIGDTGSSLKLFVLGEARVLGGPQRFSSTIICKTEEGYWSTFGVPRKTSKLIHEYLKRDPMLENF